MEGSTQKREGYGQAIATFDGAVDLYPDHHEARNMLGLLYSLLEMDDEAAVQFKS